MRWTVQGLTGGPRRVNHASVAVGKIVYSFGGESLQGKPSPLDLNYLVFISDRLLHG